jgi:hypothetical protein
METFLVYFSQGLKIVFALALLFGWILAWRFKSKGGGKSLWIIYGICIVIAAVLMIFYQDLFVRNDAIREWFMSDTGFVAEMNGGRGLRFPAAQSISMINGIQIMGMLFCIIALFVWTGKLNKKLPQEK